MNVNIIRVAFVSSVNIKNENVIYLLRDNETLNLPSILVLAFCPLVAPRNL